MRGVTTARHYGYRDITGVNTGPSAWYIYEYMIESKGGREGCFSSDQVAYSGPEISRPIATNEISQDTIMDDMTACLPFGDLI